MAKKSYEIGEDAQAQEWASGQLGRAPEAGEAYELDLDKEQETALVAAGWLTESESKKGGKD